MSESHYTESMTEEKTTPYRVLARKYRSRNFDELIGQDSTVRTLKNAIESKRIAQAYMLTGVRGVGKTSIARIIAKSLNYTGPDDKAGPTTGATDDCELCQAISEDRHPDVMEMDAASRTGVDDIREILDGVRYAPTSARYKVYIIDEVHMLSKQAFNALLKTLEEPPDHVIFIFATTEIRKVPITVLSRCQRFDLRRVDVPTLEAHYKKICEWEKVTADEAALALIARAADGSVRDGLSLLDQAIALGSGDVTTQQVNDMLGLVDRTRVMDVLDHALKGECAEALDLMEALYANGADPLVLVQDLLNFTHLLTKLRAVPGQKAAQGVIGQDAFDRASSMAVKLSMPTLGRAWQIILKGIDEVNVAPHPQAAAEMIVIRLAYAADLPDPATLIKKLKNQQDTTPAPVANPVANVLPAASEPEPVSAVAVSAAGGDGGSSAMAASAPVPVPQITPDASETLATLEDIVSLLELQKEMILAGQVYHGVHLVKLELGLLEMRQKPEASPTLAQDLRKFLMAATGRQWMISISSSQGLPTLAEQKEKIDRALMEKVKENPVVRDVLVAFPGTVIEIKGH